jgi:hypothetical protein
MKRCVLTLCGTPQEREHYVGLQPYGHNAGGTTVVSISVAYLFRLAELDRLMADEDSTRRSADSWMRRMQDVSERMR